MVRSALLLSMSLLMLGRSLFQQARACDIKEWRDSWYLAQAAAARHPLDVHGFDPHSHTSCPGLGER